MHWCCQNPATASIDTPAGIATGREQKNPVLSGVGGVDQPGNLPYPMLADCTSAAKSYLARGNAAVAVKQDWSEI